MSDFSAVLFMHPGNFNLFVCFLSVWSVLNTGIFRFI